MRKIIVVGFLDIILISRAACSQVEKYKVIRENSVYKDQSTAKWLTFLVVDQALLVFP